MKKGCKVESLRAPGCICLNDVAWCNLTVKGAKLCGRNHLLFIKITINPIKKAVQGAIGRVKDQYASPNMNV